MRRASLPLLFVLAGCFGSDPASEQAAPEVAPAEKAAAPGPDPAEVRKLASALFKPLPEFAARQGAERPSDSLVALGRALYHDPRLSVNDRISCNSCHDLARFGADGEPTSPGHDGTRGGRNSPTVLNAALHATQFWDGRAADVEEQATGPILNPVEMGMPDAAAVEAKVRGISEYEEMFAAAFPGADQPVTLTNIGVAIGAFERGLLTPAPFDRFLKGDDEAMTPEQLAGLKTFVDVGCTSCHNGVALGGQGFFKLGQVVPYETSDLGRFDVTQNEADKHFFKPPSLRNITETGPWFHDGSVTDLGEAVRLMAKHQLGRELDDDQVRSILAFLGALKGDADAEYAKAPTLPGM